MRLHAENLSGERGGSAVFSGVGFSLGAGDALGVIGPNGAGKSTLLRVVAGLLPAAEGRVGLEGEDPETWPSVGAACHYLGHLNALQPALGLAENLLFWQRFLGASLLEVDAALAAVGLAGLGHLPCGALSTGQRRRAAIARLLVSRRPIWLLDEPTAGLDRAAETRFDAILARHRDDGGIVLAATHAPLGLAGAVELALPGAG